MGAGAVFTLARFSEAFLILRGTAFGFFNLMSGIAMLINGVTH